jgi:hypothetical protein
VNTDTVTVKRRGRPSNGVIAQAQKRVVEEYKQNPNLTMAELGARAGVARQTASEYLAKWGINKQEVDTFVENRNAIVKSKQAEILRALTPDKIEKATAKDLTVCYGILLDKDRLESGESTANIHQWTAIVQASNRKEVDITPNNV